MKTSCSLRSSSQSSRCAFTLIELAVVLGTVGMLSILCVTAMAGAKGQSRIAVCSDNIRQLVGASQIYANDNQGVLPTSSSGGAAWPWDLPLSTGQSLLNTGLQKKNFYCPGTEPRFTDWQNWQNPGPGNNLWDFSPSYPNGFHIIGYTLAYWGLSSKLSLTNQNFKISPELIKPPSGNPYMVAASQRILVADVILSNGRALPGYSHPENNYVSISGGFAQNGIVYPHLSAHLKGQVPAGHNLGFKDGHVEWHMFDVTVVPRTGNNTPYFWW